VRKRSNREGRDFNEARVRRRRRTMTKTRCFPDDGKCGEIE
jgi:hypothetical protein